MTRNRDRIDGVRIVAAGGAEQTIKGRFVVGADGPSSTIAARVNAAQYHDAPAQQVTMWGYWSGVPGYGLAVKSDGGRAVWLIPSSGGDSMVGVSWEMTRYKSLRGEVEKGYYASIAELSPLLSSQLKQNLLSSELRLGSTRTYLRVPHGPGWVLLGEIRSPTSTPRLVMMPLNGARISCKPCTDCTRRRLVSATVTAA